MELILVSCEKKGARVIYAGVERRGEGVMGEKEEDEEEEGEEE